MNADFEVELATPAGRYRRLPAFEALNRRLSEHLLWLARPGDALLAPEPWSKSLRAQAGLQGVDLVSTAERGSQSGRAFTPWGWTNSAIAVGERAGASVRPIPIGVVARVNSKLWSHALEVEWGITQEGAALADSFEELEGAVARACPRPGDKWVVKSPFGFAARDRVLGRGPKIEEPQAKWSRKRLARGETLIFQPWLEVIREYGVVMEILENGAVELLGISDLQTNGAGTGTGYILGRPPAPQRARELESIARRVCERLYGEGYFGPAGIDALEHRGGLHPLLEVNARYTMGFIALARERNLKPAGPVFWSTK
jgi:hypothetical protein